jgi:hypothetical protein
MALGDNNYYVVVAFIDTITGVGGQVTLKVGDSIAGLNAVAIVGGNYNASDPWVITLMKQIAGSRRF